MQRTLPTVKIKDGSGFLIINRADFDPEKHRLFVEGETPSASGKAIDAVGRDSLLAIDGIGPKTADALIAAGIADAAALKAADPAALAATLNTRGATAEAIQGWQAQVTEPKAD